MNALPKVVFSQSLSEVTWSNARLSRAPIEDEIDEYRLTVHPVALGDGLPLMHGLPEPLRLEMISSTAYADGCVTQVFTPA
jgi:dihydrofolate reductase